MSEVSWAKELGIDMGELMAEHPLSRESLLEAGACEAKARRYWSKDRILARVEPERQPDWYSTKPEGYRWISVEDLAKRLSIGTTTVRSWIEQGLLPEKQPGEPGLRMSQSEIDYLYAPIAAKRAKKVAQVVVEPEKIAVKRTRVKNYVFTEAQMRVAERSLNAGGAV